MNKLHADFYPHTHAHTSTHTPNMWSAGYSKTNTAPSHAQKQERGITNKGAEKDMAWLNGSLRSMTFTGQIGLGIS